MITLVSSFPLAGLVLISAIIAGFGWTLGSWIWNRIIT